MCFTRLHSSNVATGYIRDIVPIVLFNVHGQYTESKHFIAIEPNANGNFHLRLITWIAMAWSTKSMQACIPNTDYNRPREEEANNLNLL